MVRFSCRKDGVFQTVQCKFTSSKNNGISLRSQGGTKGTTYDNILNHPVDLLFCATSDSNLFLIPVSDIRQAGNTKQIVLRTTPNSNNQGFNTYPYLVEI